MNGNGHQPTIYTPPPTARYGFGSPTQMQPIGQTLYDGYRGSPGSPNGERLPVSPLNKASSRSSVLFKPNDPISMHLLMETAIGDSREYEVLSLEEVDELKRELEITKTRTESAKRKLKLDSKLHDAAQSLNRLYSKKGQKPSGDKMALSPKTHRRGLMSSIGSSGGIIGRRDSSSSDFLNKTDDEMIASTRKCEELAQDIRQSEERAQQLERRLLEHTAGILHMTHRGLEKDRLVKSPDSVYSIGFPTSREDSSQVLQLQDFDSRSLYRPIDPMDGFDDDMYDLGNRKLDSNQGRLGPALSQRLLEQAETIKITEQKLQDLNERLMSSISQVNENTASNAALSRQHEGTADDVDTDVHGQLEQLERNLDDILDDHFNNARAAERKLSIVAKKFGDANTRLHSIISRSGQVRERAVQHSPPPGIYDEGLEAQLAYLGFGLDNLAHDIQQLFQKVETHFVRASALEEQNDILARQFQQQRDLTGKGDAHREAQVSDLRAELEVVRTNFEKLKREASGTQDELALATEQLEAGRQYVALREQERGMGDSKALAAEREARRESEEHLFAELQAKQDHMAQLQAEIQDFRDDASIAQAEIQSKLEESEMRMQKAMAEVEVAKAAQANEASLKQIIHDKTEELDKVHADMQIMESQLVRLQTEATVARAELDGAYGTRAQRAAEVASNPALEAELDEITARNASLLEEIAALKAQLDASGNGGAELAQHVENLKRELSETIAEYEIMTKASIEFEKEREQLECMIDSQRDRCESLESQLSDERVKWLGIRSPGTAPNRDSMVPGTTSTMVLKNEFKKMMRETRAENMKALRYEQDERRKLEALIRSLKREQVPGTLTLSNSMTTH